MPGQRCFHYKALSGVEKFAATKYRGPCGSRPSVIRIGVVAPDGVRVDDNQTTPHGFDAVSVLLPEPFGPATTTRTGGSSRVRDYLPDSDTV
jgi:hypothetical protein